MSDNRPKTYKGKPVEYRGEISDREPFTGKEEGIYYLISATMTALDRLIYGLSPTHIIQRLHI